MILYGFLYGHTEKYKWECMDLLDKMRRVFFFINGLMSTVWFGGYLFNQCLKNGLRWIVSLMPLKQLTDLILLLVWDISASEIQNRCYTHWNCAKNLLMVTADIRVHEFFKTSYFKMGIQPLPGAQRALHKLSRYCNLSIVTSVLLVKFLSACMIILTDD